MVRAFLHTLFPLSVTINFVKVLNFDKADFPSNRDY